MIGHQAVQLGEPVHAHPEAPPPEHRPALVHHRHVVVGLGPVDAHEDHGPSLGLPLCSEPEEVRGDLMDQCSTGTPSHQPSDSSPTGRGTL